MTFEEFYKKIEIIVKNDGDETLNIKNFIKKMISELEVEYSTPESRIKYVSEFNQIPEELIKILWENKDKYKKYLKELEK